MKTGEINNKSGIYTITNIVNNKMYIGYCYNFTIRRNQHKSNLLNNTHPNKHLQSAYNKYSGENFIFEILEECSQNYLASQENYWVNLFNVINNEYGYNIRPTDPYDKPRHSQKTKDKISFLVKGEKSVWYGKKHSEITKIKISIGNKGKHGMKGINHPMFGTTGGMFGKKHSLETKRKMSKALLNRSKELIIASANKRKKILIQMNLQNNFIKEWVSAKEASKELNINYSCIIACCNKKQNTAGNFKWKYKLE